MASLRSALCSMPLAALALLATVGAAKDSALRAQDLPRKGIHVDVTIAAVCQAVLPEVIAGLARFGVSRPAVCPSRSAVIIHQPEKNRFVLRDSVKAQPGGTDRVVSYQVEAQYQVDDNGHPIWTAVHFQSEGGG
ncbi:hypothetical protein [Azorhizobium caulinodans]|nr:hypothetical protein [Azorhizobium caulinodans]